MEIDFFRPCIGEATIADAIAVKSNCCDVTDTGYLHEEEDRFCSSISAVQSSPREPASEILSARKVDFPTSRSITPSLRASGASLSPGHEEATDVMCPLVSDAFLHTALSAETLLVGDVDQDPTDQAGHEAGEAPSTGVTAKVDSSPSASVPYMVV